MLSLTLLRTMNGPIPALFTGDPTHATQFIQDLASLVWKNPNHPLVSTSWTRIDMALAFISGPATLTWKRNIRCGRSTEAATDTLWDDFLESFCETWIHSPESMISIVDPTIQTSTTDIPSPSLAAASTLKRVEEISTILTADELSPQQLSESIDQTTDDDDNDDWSSFAPGTSALPPTSPRQPPPRPPRSPRRQFSPRIASPQSVVLDLVKPADEPPRLPCTPAPDSSIVASTPSRAETLELSTPANNTAAPSPVRGLPPSLPVPVNKEVIKLASSDLDEWALFAPRTELTITASAAVELQRTTTSAKDNDEEPLFPPRTPAPLTSAAHGSMTHATGETTKKRKYENSGRNDTRPTKNIHAQLARRRVPLPRQLRYARRRPVIPPPPVDDSSGPSDLDLTFDLSVTAPDSPPPRPPHHPHRPLSPRLLCSPAPGAVHPPLLPTAVTPSIVEDDNSLGGGMKTLDTSALAQIQTALPPQISLSADQLAPIPRKLPRSPRYANIFPRHAVEMPRDPNEVAPVHNSLRAEATEFIPHSMPQSHRCRTRTHRSDVVTRNNDRHAHAEHHTHQTAARERPASSHALTRSRDERRPGPQQRTHNPPTVSEDTPRSPITGPTQVHGSRLALQRPASYLAHALTRDPPDRANQSKKSVSTLNFEKTGTTTLTKTTAERDKNKFIRDE
ncbi:hypothetical protein EDB85DRAFT_2016028 [Lactarius pseudohatsudake]|nr:hypothetical protein EDB85DRAFT_2016028 [Lactarius pseudohatsudake]